MIRLIHTADLHIFNHKSVDSGRINRIYKNAMLIVKIAIKHKCKYIVIAGDIFNNHNPDEKLLKIFAKIISKGLKNGIKWRILIGNHDTDGEHHSLESLSDILGNFDNDDIKIFDGNESVTHTEFLKDDGGEYAATVTYIPYNQRLSLSEVVKSSYDDRNNSLVNLLFTHGAVTGASTSTDYKMKDGELNLADFDKRWDYIGLGDFHKWQQIALNAYYSGSIAKLNWGERNDVKKINIITIKDGKHKVNVKKLPDISFIQAKVNYINCIKFKGKKLKVFRKQNVEGSIIKLYIHNVDGMGKDIYYLKKALYDGGAKHVQDYITKNKILLKGKNTADKSDLNLSDYVKNFAIDNMKIEDKKIIKYGTDKIEAINAKRLHV